MTPQSRLSQYAIQQTIRALIKLFQPMIGWDEFTTSQGHKVFLTLEGTGSFHYFLGRFATRFTDNPDEYYYVTRTICDQFNERINTLGFEEILTTLKAIKI